MTAGFASLMDLRAEGDDTFVGPSSPDQGSRSFGGQTLAQSLAAAQHTVDGDRSVHSTQSYFLKAGDAGEPTEYSVERLRDGRSFSQRHVVATQHGVELMRSIISFQVPEQGLEWHEPLAIDVSPPTEVQPYADYNDVTESILPDEERPWTGRDRPLDVRYINPPTYQRGRPVTEPQLMWVRVRGRLGHDRALHYTGLMYLADMGMNAVIVLPHGLRWRDDLLVVASLNHTMWFHRAARSDEWLYYEQRVESTAAGRGLAKGRFYSHDGSLVATCMQEGLMRWNA